jgi:N-acetylmuramoyl-L-alanine amidase
MTILCLCAFVLAAFQSTTAMSPSAYADDLSFGASHRGTVVGAATGGIQDISASTGLKGIRGGSVQMGRVRGMVVHHTSGRSNVMGVVNTLKERGLSVQFVIDRDGNIWRIIPEGQQASHIRPGGTGTIGAAGQGLGNHNLEGVEVIAKNDKDVTPEQRAAVGRLVGRRARKFGYDPKTSIYGHGELNGHKERDEGMSSVSRIRSGEISTDPPSA